MRSWLLTALRLTPVVAIVSGLSVVGLVGFRSVISLEQLRPSNSEVGTYIQTVGGIYAVLLAFVVYVVWGQFNDAHGLIHREATALVDLHRTASGLPAGTRAAIQEGLRDYTDAVLTDEWQAMTHYDQATIDRVGHRLDEVWTAIHACRPMTECQHIVFGEVLSRFNTLTDIRTGRLTSASSRIPHAMKILLYTGAILTIGSMYLMAIDAFWVHATVTAALAGAIAHVLFLIRDLDDAFAGDWQVAKEPFVRARLSFERATHLVDHA
ncbi:MAG: DUF4239 domain-containing protein [Deltaproteobacteria bacterium]|nr:DUF4239 domain-containing protein [Deltaproteobacteria bacterium]